MAWRPKPTNGTAADLFGMTVARIVAESKGGKYRAHQTSLRVVLCGPAGRASCDGCGSLSSVVDLDRLRDLRSFVDWFCDRAQRPSMISRGADGKGRRDALQ
jgi:hypothetical protein